MPPGRDGIEVPQNLRRQGTKVPVLLTAKDAVEDHVLGLDAGADDYLVKPFEVDCDQSLGSIFRISMPKHISTQVNGLPVSLTGTAAEK